MPIVFVHGVDSRKTDADYASGIKVKEEYLISILASRLGLDARKVRVTFPYWGDGGVKFRWNQASLPSSADAAVALGQSDSEKTLWFAEALYQLGSDKLNLAMVTDKRGFEVAVDLVWDLASAVFPIGTRDTAIAEYYQASLAYATADSTPKWTRQNPLPSNEQFVNLLVQHAAKYLPNHAVQAGDVALGGGDWLRSVREALSRLDSTENQAIASLAMALGRRQVHKKASGFLGDVFVYLSTRDNPSADAILTGLIHELRESHKARQDGDDKLIVIGHSLGGLLIYDVLTHYAPDVKVDVFVTVGSQVALFEEMSLCKASKSGLPANPPKDKLLRPSSVGLWLNVYDANDAFSFRAEGVFAGVTDFEFSTGYGLLQAHSGYFMRPSFYKRLAARVGVLAK